MVSKKLNIINFSKIFFKKRNWLTIFGLIFVFSAVGVFLGTIQKSSDWIKCMTQGFTCCNGKPGLLDCDYPPNPESKSTYLAKVINLNTTCKLSFTQSELSQAQIRQNMLDLYSCPIGYHLEKVKNKSLKLERPQSQSELLLALFGSEKIAVNISFYKGENFELFYWSKSKENSLNVDSFEVHEAFSHDDEAVIRDAPKTSIYTDAIAKMAAPMLLNQEEIYERRSVIVVRTGVQFDILSYDYLQKLIDPKSETDYEDLIMLNHKLLGLNNKYYNFELEIDMQMCDTSGMCRSTTGIKDYKRTYELAALKPLIFQGKYDFDSKSKGFSSRCGQGYQGNLETKISTTNDMMEFYAHDIRGRQLYKVTISNLKKNPEVEYKSLLLCYTSIIC